MCVSGRSLVGGPWRIELFRDIRVGDMPVGCFGLVGDEDGTECGYGYHEYRNAGLDLLPEQFPKDIEGIRRGSNAGGFNDGDDAHYGAQA